jgi:diguanylate cyclase (GGDEF)-like protein
MGNLIPADPPRLPDVGLLAAVGGGALVMVGLAIAASLFELQHDRDVQRQNEDALTMSQLAFDAESLASRMRALQEMGTQPGARAPMVASPLREVLRAVDIDQAEWERRITDTQGRNLPPEAKAQLAKLDTAIGTLRSAVELPPGSDGAVASGSTAPLSTTRAEPATGTGSGAVAAAAAASAASDSAYLAAVEAAQGTLRASVRASSDRIVFYGYTASQLAAGVVAAASLLALLLGAFLAALVNRARHESRVTIGVMGQLLRTDPLTGIANRRGLDENLPVEMSRGKRDGKTLTVAMLDLDFFKRYNSRRGHAGGDSLLRIAAQAWRKQLRPTDTLVRYGGEEFTLVLPSCDAEQACQLIDRLRPLLPDGQTFSAGVATWDFNESGEALLRRADEALLLAKKQGRNRTMVAGREDQISLALSTG